VRWTDQFAYTQDLVSTMYPVLYQSLDQRWSASCGVCRSVGVSWVQPIQAISYRALTV